MKKNVVYILLLISFVGKSQEKGTWYIPDIYPKTPENVALIKNIDLPPGTYTGTYGYKVDLGNISLKNLNLPISLDYSTTGVKVNAISGRIGTGWVLNVGNISLNRDVRGVSDNTIEEFKLEKKYFEFQPNNDDPVISGPNGDYTLATKLAGISRTAVINSPTLDANKDYFIYSLNSNSGRFIQDSKGKFHTIPKDDAKILNTKTLIDNQGNTYYFTEYANISNFNMYSSIDGDGNGVAMPYKNTSFAFRLDSIKLPTDEIVKFNYETDNYNYTSSFNKSLDIKIDGTDKSPLKPCIDYNGASVNRAYQLVTDFVIKEISYPNGKIIFDYTLNNQEVIGGKVLKNVKFYQNNQLYKNYNLESDFTTSTIPSQIIPQYNNENLSKRLFLFKVNESLTNTNYLFNYYGVNKITLKTDFPSRFSGKEDYWGSYSSIGDFLPTSNKYIDKFGILTFYQGADKNPILNDAIIGSMESIQLPTGGFQKIKYDLDDFYDEGYKEIYQEVINNGVAVSHSEVMNKVTKTITINENSFISNATIFFSYPGIGYINYDPNTSSLPTVSYYYVDVSINGKHWKRLIGKEGESLEFKDMIRNGDVIAFQFHYVSSKFGTPLDSGAWVDISYTINKEKDIPFVYRKAGNLRMQELMLKESANSETYKKQYLYKKFDKPDEPSSFFLGRDMNMNYYSVKPYNHPVIENEERDVYCEYLNVSSQNNFNLYALENKSVVYPNVTEKIINVKDNSFYTIEKEFSIPNKIAYSEYQLPFTQGSYNGFMGGLLKNEIHKDDKGNIIKTITNTYEFDNYFNQFSSKYDTEYPEYIYPAMDISVRSSYTGSARGLGYTFDVNVYHYPSTWIKLKETKEVDFFNNSSIEKIKTFTYNYNQIKPIKEVTKNSKGETLTTEYQYPPDLVSDYEQSEIMQEMVKRNMIATPVITKSINEPTVLSEQRTLYKYFPGTSGNLILPEFVYAKKGKNTTVNDRKITYNSYDAKGNLTQYTLENGIPVAIIWGYNGQYPVAKIEGSTFANATSKLANYLTKIQNGTLTATEQSTIRTLIPDAMLTSYTYKPLIGVTSITGPNGQSEFYNYDSSNRLQSIVNEKNEVIKTFEYNYKQP
ncbi:hypothetical protein [Empedobacter tilapiae]|uniref:hypothetical protein n=1 Tax=Empedobacter tilapiae TaxID=2491114 RepID=UPI0028D15CFB|nr:hypothetical protein [Empedobacter tilapiae]